VIEMFDLTKFEKNLEKTLKPIFDEFNLKFDMIEFEQNLRKAIGD